MQHTLRLLCRRSPHGDSHLIFRARNPDHAGQVSCGSALDLAQQRFRLR